MTINPVNTRLARASALELRSKICAMNESRFDCRCTCAACAGGHMGCVQEPLFDKALMNGLGSPKFQYSARGSLTTRELRKKCEKNMWETELQQPEKKTAWAKREFQATTDVYPALVYQKLGCSLRKFHDERSQHLQPQIPLQHSPRTLPSGPAGHPTITRNTSRTKRPMAMSLNRDAWGRFGQSWFAAQKRKAAANRMVLNSSGRGRRCAN